MTLAGIARKDVITIQRGETRRWLHPTEADQFAALSPAARTDWLAGRIALKHACQRHAGGGLKAHDLLVMNSLAGVPHVTQLPRLRCTLSHSEGWGIAAVDSCPIGIDLERVRPRSGSLWCYIADRQELEEAQVWGPSQDAAATRLWTIKESALKAWGVGLTVSPRAVRLRRREGTGITVDWMCRGCSVGQLSAVVVEANDRCIALSSAGRLCEQPFIHWADARCV